MTLLKKLPALLKQLARKAGVEVSRYSPALENFHSTHYLRHNARRLEHLASLRLPVAGKSVLEVGAGIGDLSHYFLDRGCRVTITEAREENLHILRHRYPGADIRPLDLENAAALASGPFEVVHCYGLLYHLANPAQALEFLSRHSSDLLLLETCVSFGNEMVVNLTGEPQDNPTQAWSGTGCRPTRPWVFAELKKHFPHVYVPATQPNHEEFPLDWTRPELHHAPLLRAVFIASRTPLEIPGLLSSLPDLQTRHP